MKGLFNPREVNWSSESKIIINYNLRKKNYLGTITSKGLNSIGLTSMGSKGLAPTELTSFGLTLIGFNSIIGL